MINKVILVGRLGRDPETRYMSNNEPVCNFSLATDENWKDKDGKTQSKCYVIAEHIEYKPNFNNSLASSQETGESEESSAELEETADKSVSEQEAVEVF